MIVTRTPFRVTLGGGGTDLPSYYERHGGFIFAMGIDKYMYVMSNPPTVDSKIRLHYSQSETVDHVGELKHELAREALRLHGIEEKMEISSMADLPAGTGVGSSSSYLVGLLNALHHYRRDLIPLQALAEEACYIELEVLKKGIGKQDQYMACFGGLTVLDIERDGKVTVRQVELGASSLAALVANTHIYYTGVQRDAQAMLDNQNRAMENGPKDPKNLQIAESLHRIKDLGHRILDAVASENYDLWGRLLDEHWQNKRRLSANISFPKVDILYDEVRANYGVLGGKLIGAGGGGLLMLYCPKNHKQLERYMFAHGMPRLHYAVEWEGTKVVANVASTKSMAFHSKASMVGRKAVPMISCSGGENHNGHEPSVETMVADARGDV